MIKLKLFLEELLSLISEYKDIFFQKYRKNYKTDYTQYWDIYILTFGFLKIIDLSLKFSKEDVIECYNKYYDIANIETLLFKISLSFLSDFVLL